jgi:hypothetical protein
MIFSGITLPSRAYRFLHQPLVVAASGARKGSLLDFFKYNDWDPRVIHLGLAQNSFPVPFPTVQAGPLSETDPLKPDADLGGGKKGNYIQWLRQASASDIQAENYPGPKPTALLYKILRQSVVLDYAKLATFAEISASRLEISQIREQEILGVQPQAQATVGAAPQAQALPKVACGKCWRGLPYPIRSSAGLNIWSTLIRRHNPIRTTCGAARLPRSPVSLSTAELDRLLTETLDACSHRLDVWVTAVATSILNRKRSAQVNGVHLGCFGWVEEVRPAAPRPAVQGTELETVRLLDSRRATTLKAPSQLAGPGTAAAG